MLETARLILRQWRDEDYPVYACLVADPQVMRYSLAPLSRQESYLEADAIRNSITAKGWGLWAIELKATGEFIGYTGLCELGAESGIPYTPFIEAAWRLRATHWGKGYATEAAKRALCFAFQQLNVAEVCAVTALINQPSQRVMIKAGMKNSNKDFNNPKLPAGHELERYSLYYITRLRWLRAC